MGGEFSVDPLPIASAILPARFVGSGAISQRA